MQKCPFASTDEFHAISNPTSLGKIICDHLLAQTCLIVALKYDLEKHKIVLKAALLQGQESVISFLTSATGEGKYHPLPLAELSPSQPGNVTQKEAFLGKASLLCS